MDRYRLVQLGTRLVLGLLLGLGLGDARNLDVHEGVFVVEAFLLEEVACVFGQLFFLFLFNLVL